MCVYDITRQGQEVSTGLYDYYFEVHHTRYHLNKLLVQYGNHLRRESPEIWMGATSICVWKALRRMIRDVQIA